MSSYYSQRIQYKTKGKQYNRATAVINDDVDDIKYTAHAAKKMATLNSSSYAAQKADNSTCVPFDTSDFLIGSVDDEVSTSAHKFEIPTTPSKISTHLLDHGYGATPQPAFVQDDADFKGYTKTAEAGITHYYKVSSNN